jgi:hypothetical protein
VSELLGALLIGQKHGNVIARESGNHETVYRMFRLCTALVDAENGCIFACHNLVTPVLS